MRIAVYILIGFVGVTILMLLPSSGRQTVPTSSVASEVCEHNGPIVGVTKDNGLLYVTCKSGSVQLVDPNQP